MKKVFCVLLCVLLLPLCACAKEPDEEYVIGAEDGTAESVLTAGPAKTPEAAAPQPSPDPAWSASWEGAQPVFPERWEDDIRTDYKEIVIAADVVVSGQENYPVYLVKTSRCTEEDLLKIAGYVFPEVSGWRRGLKPSKEQITEAIAYVSGSDLSESDKQTQLETLDEALDRTPYTNAENKACTGLADIPPAELSECTVFLKDGNIGSMTINNTTNSLHVCIHNTGAVQPKSFWKYSPEEAPQFTAGIGLDEAKAKAEAFFSAVGIEGYELYRADEARCIDFFSTRVYSTGWDLRFVPSFGYIPYSASEYDATVNGLFNYRDSETPASFGWRTETIGLYISENGIEYVSLHDPYEYEKLAGNVRLAELDGLTAGIKRILAGSIGSEKQSEGWFEIEEMILTYAVQEDKSSDNEAYLIPAWVCRISGYEAAGENWMSHFCVPGEKRLVYSGTIVFSAIDGSRILIPSY